MTVKSAVGMLLCGKTPRAQRDSIRKIGECNLKFRLVARTYTYTYIARALHYNTSMVRVGGDRERRNSHLVRNSRGCLELREGVSVVMDEGCRTFG